MALKVSRKEVHQMILATVGLYVIENLQVRISLIGKCRSYTHNGGRELLVEHIVD